MLLTSETSLQAPCEFLFPSVVELRHRGHPSGGGEWSPGGFGLDFSVICAAGHLLPLLSAPGGSPVDKRPRGVSTSHFPVVIECPDEKHLGRRA